MVARPLKTAPAGAAIFPEAQLDRLLEANERLQAQLAEKLAAEKDWEAERALFRAMIDQVPDYLFAKDTESRFIVANRAVAADLGRRPGDLIGKTDFDLHSAELAAKFRADELRVIESGEAAIDIEEYVISIAGDRKWMSTSKVPLRGPEGRIVGIVGISRDITERKRAEDQIHFMAHHDALTGLPNRTLLMDRLEQALLQAKRHDHSVTVIFIDLDNFKIVNDSLGHRAGDALLKIVAERLVDCVRSSDTVARLGGDEFVIVLVEPDGEPGGAGKVLKRIRTAMSEPVPVEGRSFRVTCSIGVATYWQDGADADTLLINADVAMYRAKEKGRGTILRSGRTPEAVEERRQDVGRTATLTGR